MERSHGSLRFALRYWLHDPALDDPTDTAVRVRLYAALQRAGLQLASPETVVRNIHESTHHDAVVEARDVARRPSALARVSVFSGLSSSELDTLALRLVQALEAVDNQLAHPEQVTSDKLMIRILNFFGVSNVAQ